jgi:hypothetical protein
MTTTPRQKDATPNQKKIPIPEPIPYHQPKHEFEDPPPPDPVHVAGVKPQNG